MCDPLEHLNTLLCQIRTWDKTDIQILKDTIDHIAEIERDCGVSRLDYSDLPTEPIPAGLETYPIWAMDVKGRCLVGDAADSIEDIEDIRAWYDDKQITPHTITADGYESIEKTAKRNGNSSAVTLPASWLGHRVLCIRLD